MTSGDNSNILTARIARENYGIHSVVARIYDPRRAEIYQRLGDPHRRHRDVDDRPGDAPAAPRSRRRGMERPLGTSRPRRARPARVLGRQGTCATSACPGKVKVVAVTRAGMPRLEVTDLVGQEGDVLHLAVLKDAVGELEHRFDGGAALPEGRAFGSAR